MRPALLEWNSSRRNERRAGRKPSQARRVIKGGLASALAVVGLVAFATPAFAHNDIVTATAACNSRARVRVQDHLDHRERLQPLRDGNRHVGDGRPGHAEQHVVQASRSRPTRPTRPRRLTQTLPATASGTITLDISSTWSDNYSVTDTGSFSLSSLNCAAPKQTIAGHIYLCNNGNPTTIEKTGGMLSADGSGLSTVSPTANPLAPTDVIAGAYTMTANSPPGYALVNVAVRRLRTDRVVRPPSRSMSRAAVPASVSSTSPRSRRWPGTSTCATTGPPLLTRCRWHGCGRRIRAHDHSATANPLPRLT